MSRAILINDLRNGGAERVVSKILNKNYNTTILIQIWPEQFNNVVCEEVFFLLDKKGFILIDLLKASFSLYRLIKKKNITLINSHLFWSNYLNIFVSFFTKHQTIVTHCVSFVSKFKRKSLAYFFHDMVCGLLLKKAMFHIYKSNDMKHEYETTFKLTNGHVIYNPINVTEILDLSTQATYFKFNQDKKYLLYVGRFHATKKQSSLVSSMVFLPLEYELILLGDGPMLTECKKLAINLNVIDRVHFLGQQANPYPFYKNSDIFISVSESEGFPNALVEAIALKCYPIHLDCPTGPKEILSINNTEKTLEKLIIFERYGLGILLKCSTPAIVSKAILHKFSTNATISEISRGKFLATVESEHIFSSYQLIFNKGENNV